LTVPIEAKWIKCFVETFKLSGAEEGDVVAVLSETQSREVLVKLSELALLQIGAKLFHVKLPTPPLQDPVPMRSTGATPAVQGIEQVISALATTKMVVDCTVEGMLHAPELPAILAGGTRLMMISNEHPEILERCMPNPALKPNIDRGLKMLSDAKIMRVTSAVGTSLEIDVTDASGRGGAGYVEGPGKVGYWPAGLCLCFPKANSTNGTVVLDRGDVNLTFKRYLETPITLTFKNDFVVKIDGNGLDAQLMREYYEAFNDQNAYAVSHVGWGMNPAARWDSLVMFDKDQINGTELRALAGSFLLSTGANEFANRFTRGHFDLPMRHCNIWLDDQQIIDEGRLLPPLAY